MTDSTVAVSERLAGIARDHAAALPWRPWFTPRGRSARRVLTGPDHEVWLLAWLPGQGTELHDHGGRRAPCPAGFAVASGRLTEYRVLPGETPRLARRTVDAPEAVAVEPRVVHAMVNHTDDPAVSVHVYGPRLGTMRRYLFDESGLWLAATLRPGGDWSPGRDRLPRHREGAVASP
ncbi:Cysteine dioxygenase type I [Stackebrandtia albiflava]|uniref:Cysteine dioxygenase type I n=1 Tax=Stackebrandtia albiflava TaxID=406432 RepID=A0A562V194_9ACTN|nr:cysteine dioxygenase family protein [Stackebrandtia albiflava]TWJ11572.1 Cysteine dioxygenase type I [Stackebrandtia albiflava]